jgi:N-acetylglucosamine kinase-like BadF-type ATPase
MTASRLILAIEGGGTKTDVLLVTAEGQELGRARGGPGNLHSVGPVGLSRLFEELLGKLGSRRAVRPNEVSVVSLAMAGVDSEAEQDSVREAVLAAGLKAPVVVNSDARATLLGACGPAGLLVIAGTGSIAFGRNSEGREKRAGGWGHAFGDEGSAYDLGRRALAFACRVVDGRSHPGALSDRVLAALGVTAGTPPRPAILCLLGQVRTIAALAPVVLETAQENDPVARGIVDTAARQLLDMVDAVATPLGFDDGPFAMALHGGLLARGKFYSRRFEEMVHLLWPQADVRHTTEDAGLLGAAELGRVFLAGGRRE